MILGHRIVFSFSDSLHGTELWINDGTPGGAFILADINPGIYGSQPKELVTVDSLVFFSEFNHMNRRELWQTDGTPASTKMTQDINHGPGSSTPGTLDYQLGHLYFNAFTPPRNRAGIMDICAELDGNNRNGCRYRI